jgi:hypothetical protein
MCLVSQKPKKTFKKNWGASAWHPWGSLAWPYKLFIVVGKAWSLSIVLSKFDLT